MFLKTFHTAYLSEVGANRAPDTAAGPLPGHFSLHCKVKGQDGALQFKRAQTGEKKLQNSSVTF